MFFEVRERVAHTQADGRTSLKMWEEGDPLLSLGALALLENGWRAQGLDTVQSSRRAVER